MKGFLHPYEDERGSKKSSWAGLCVNCLHIFGKMGESWKGLLEQGLGPLWKEALASDSHGKMDLA